VKREAVIAGLASEGLALLLGSAEAGSSAVQDIFIFPADALESLWDNLLQRYLCQVSRLCRPASIGLAIIAPSRLLNYFFISL